MTYWLMDPELNRVKVYRRAAAGSFQRADELTAAPRGILETPFLPEWSSSLPCLFG